jgi:hypothetical protein
MITGPQPPSKEETSFGSVTLDGPDEFGLHIHIYGELFLQVLVRELQLHGWIRSFLTRSFSLASCSTQGLDPNAPASMFRLMSDGVKRRGSFSFRIYMGRYELCQGHRDVYRLLYQEKISADDSLYSLVVQHSHGQPSYLL